MGMKPSMQNSETITNLSTAGTALLLALCLFEAMLFPFQGFASTFWTEDFESRDFSTQSGWGPWLIQGGAPELIQPQPGKFDIVSGGCHSGSRCLKLHFNDLNVGAGPLAWRDHQSTSHIFLRYWLKMPTDFINSNISTKLLYAPRGTGQPSCLTMTQGNSRIYFNCQTDQSPSSAYAVGVADPLISNGATGPPVGDGQWHCVETEMKIGTPNGGDGLMRYWLDNNLVGELLDKTFVTTNHTFNTVRFYRERGLGDLYFDDVAVGDTRQGCSGGGGGTPVVDQPPGPPAAPRINSIN